MLIPNKINVTYGAAMPDGKRVLRFAESNAVSTEVLSYSVLKEIRTDKTTVRAGESARVTVTLTNTSAAKLLNVLFTALQPDNASFVAGSVKVNGVAQPDADFTAGFALPDLEPDGTVIIEYEIKVLKPDTVVRHFATLYFTIDDPERGYVDYYENTETVEINVIAGEINGAGQIVIRNFYNNRCRFDCCPCFDFSCCCNFCGDFCY